MRSYQRKGGNKEREKKKRWWRTFKLEEIPNSNEETFQILSRQGNQIKPNQQKRKHEMQRAREQVEKWKKAMTSAHAFVIYTRRRENKRKVERDASASASASANEEKAIRLKVSRPFLFFAFCFWCVFFLTFSMENQIKSDQINRRTRRKEKWITRSGYKWQIIAMVPHISLSDLTKPVWRGTKTVRVWAKRQSKAKRWTHLESNSRSKTKHKGNQMRKVEREREKEKEKEKEDHVKLTWSKRDRHGISS